MGTRASELDHGGFIQSFYEKLNLTARSQGMEPYQGFQAPTLTETNSQSHLMGPTVF